MATGKSGDKSSGKPARQLLLSEALHPSRPPASVLDSQLTNSLTATDNPEHSTTMDHILQEIAAVGHRLEGMDFTIATLAAETKSISLDIAGFQYRVSDLEQRVVAVKEHHNTVPDRDRNFSSSTVSSWTWRTGASGTMYICMAFRSTLKGMDIQAFFKETLPTLMGISFDPPTRVPDGTSSESKES
ncbi:hypothetical protein NDU88_004963 [Pleurodeles waltl]|uniref:Uncharacterized protein n=1 Tax=Pleurodeles waltl TaxID=8319 RepID=A0AAV7L1D1_PLEWA|nr:hypothetical protein NDU88_004963 [Pleurodeles waltl]